MEDSNKKAVHTHREDHFQVVEHLDLLREALAAPSDQVVLTVGRGVATHYFLGLNNASVKIFTKPLLCAQQVRAAGDMVVFDTDVVPLFKRLKFLQRPGWGGVGITNVYIHSLFPQSIS